MKTITLTSAIKGEKILINVEYFIMAIDSNLTDFDKSQVYVKGLTYFYVRETTQEINDLIYQAFHP